MTQLSQFTRGFVAALGLTLAAGLSAHAQSFGPFSQDAAVNVPMASTLGMGDAATAVAQPDAAFFTNPALLVYTKSGGVHVTLVGARGGFGGNAPETFRFFRDELGPAIDEGIDDIRREDPERYEYLYEETLRLGSAPQFVTGTAFGPAVQAGLGSVAISAGGFAHVTGRGQVFDSGGGFPTLDAYAQGDVVIPVSMAAQLAGTPLAIGVSAVWAQRRISAKRDPVDALDPKGEKIYVLKGESVGFDAGVYARDVVVPGFDLGASLLGIGHDFEMTFDRSVVVAGEDDTLDDPAEITELKARFNGREAPPRWRAGLAYRVPLGNVPLFSDVVIAADYVNASTSEFEQTEITSKLRFGAQAGLGGVVTVRGGLSQGYPTAGATLNAKLLRLDYAYYGLEAGRRSGQLEQVSHVLQVRIGLF